MDDSGDGDIVLMGDNIFIEKNEVVDGNVVAIGGSVTVLGKVYGDAVAIGGLSWWTSLVGRVGSVIGGGLLIALAIATMHYLGMSAIIVSERIVWDPVLIAASLLLGGLFSIA